MSNYLLQELAAIMSARSSVVEACNKGPDQVRCMSRKYRRSDCTHELYVECRSPSKISICKVVAATGLTTSKRNGAVALRREENGLGGWCGQFATTRNMVMEILNCKSD